MTEPYDIVKEEGGYCIFCRKNPCICAPQPTAINPALLHAEITMEIYKAYMPHTRNREKASKVADRVIAMLINVYEQEAKGGASME